jgi:hypothetical protein
MVGAPRCTSDAKYIFFPFSKSGFWRKLILN